MEANSIATADTGYASIMVALHLGPGASDCVRVAAELGERFGSRLIGIGAEDFVVPYVGDPIGFADASLVEEARAAAAQSLEKAEAMFRASAGRIDNLEWRSAIASPGGFILAHSRAADLVVLARYGSRDAYQGRMGVTPGDLVMDLGRPLLVVPPNAARLSARRILIAWKDTREARRAVRDALPLLKQAEEVIVLTVGDDSPEAVADVSAHLRLHGVSARGVARRKTRHDIAGAVIDYAVEQGADLVVAGAYGHSRMREWMLGGVTLDLLEETPICCLLSH